MAHLTDEQISKYMSDEMSEEEKMEFLTHTAGCDFCSGRLAAAIEKTELVTPPPDLASDILKQTVYNKTLMLNAEYFIEKQKQRQREFCMYTAKVVLAMSMAILMVFSTDIGFGYSYNRAENKVEIQYNKLTDSINKSSDKIRGSIKEKWTGFISEIGLVGYKEREDK